MGHGITVECKSCEYQDEFSLGIGMMYRSLENVLSLVSSRRRDKVRELLHHHQVDSVQYEHKLFVCPKCNTLADRFDFSIIYDGGKTYRPYFRCPKCKARLRPLETPIRETACPKCGKKTLISIESMLWD